MVEASPELCEKLCCGHFFKFVYLFINSLISELINEREIDRFVVLHIPVFIGCFLYVPRAHTYKIKCATLVRLDDAPIN